MNSVYFKEEQKFPLWLRLLSLLTSIGLLLTTISSYELEEKSVIALIIPIVILVLVNIIIFSFTIKTRIVDSIIEVESIPFFGKKRYQMIDLLDLRLHNTYKVSRFPTGWGYRVDFKGNVYHIATGFRGLWIEKKNGKGVFIGSQKTEELSKIVDYWNEKYGSKA